MELANSLEIKQVTFIPEASVLLAYITGVVLITLTPGPDMTFFISRAIGQSVPAGLVAYAGAATGIFFHTALVAFGLAALIVASPTFFTTLKLSGAIYLAFLAYQAIAHGSAFQVSNKKQKQKSLFQNWLQGLGINLLNPKIILFFMTFLPQFISVTDPHATGKLFFLGVMFILIATPMMVPMIIAAGKFSNWLQKNPKITRAIDYIFAGVFGAFAVKILFTERN